MGRVLDPPDTFQDAYSVQSTKVRSTPNSLSCARYCCSARPCLTLQCRHGIRANPSRTRQGSTGVWDKGFAELMSITRCFIVLGEVGRLRNKAKTAFFIQSGSYEELKSLGIHSAAIRKEDHILL